MGLISCDNFQKDVGSEIVYFRGIIRNNCVFCDDLEGYWE